MVRCTNKGCGQEFDPENNVDAGCVHHSGAPVFHEGLKSWSCCQSVNRPVLDFDEFMKIPGCTKGQHTATAPKPEIAKTQQSTVAATGSATTEVESGQETFARKPTIPVPTLTSAPPPPPPRDEEEDDLAAEVPPGTACRHKGCGKAFVSDEISRMGDGEEAVCTYHPKAPIFHEGSKGYLCCKRRVLEFEEFLKIEGCKKGRHLFVPKNTPTTEQTVDCRIDHYQTPTEVHVSVFAKKADQERSTVTISASEISFDLILPGPKRFRRSIELYGPVDPDASSYKYYGTKVELVLKKQDTRSWAVLEKSDRSIPLNLTFGVGGRTGTIGAKELVLDEQNAGRSQT